MTRMDALRKCLYALTLSIGFASPALAQLPDLASCTRARDEYTRLNQPLLVAHRTATDTSPSVIENGTREIVSFVREILLARLADGADAGAINTYLACMQERKGERPWDDVTNTPKIFIKGDSGSRNALAALVIMRGGIAIPNTRSFVECYSEHQHGWSHTGALEDDEQFDGHTLFVDELRSPIAGEAWYLISGRRIGDTGGRLRIEVVGCGPKGIRRVWVRDEILWGEVTIEHDSVAVSYVKRGDPQTAEANHRRLGTGSFILNDDPNDFDPKRFSMVFRITAQGLEP